MRVLFATPPAKAHAFVQVPMAWALRAAGHDVRIACPPDVVDVVTETGLTAVPVGPRMEPENTIRRSRELTEAPTTGDAPGEREFQEILAGLSDLADTAPAQTDAAHLHTVQTAWMLVMQGISPPATTAELVDVARSWRPDLVVWDTLFFAGAVAARACGAAHARLLFGLDLVAALRERYAAAMCNRPRELREDPLGEWLGLLLDQHGCAGGGVPAGTDEEAVLGQWTIDPIPASLRLRSQRPVVSVRHVPYNGPSVVPEWLAVPPRRPRVCITLGLSHREVLGGDRVSVPALLDAVADLDVEVLATLSRDQIGERRLPDNVRAVDFVPLNELLPTCSAIVHQGGFGTLQTAFAHGVPHVLLPNRTRDWDCGPLARRVAAAGAGLCVPDTEHVDGARLRELIERVLEDPSIHAGADRLRTELHSTPTPSDVVPILERLVARHRPRSVGQPRRTVA